MLKFVSEKMIDFYSGVIAMANPTRKEYFKNIYIGIGLGLIFWVFVLNIYVSYGTVTVEQFRNEIDGTISQIYKVAFTVGTAITALCAVIAFAMRMSPNQQRASVASQWLIRIFIGYAALASIGLIITIVKGIAQNHGAWGFQNHIHEDYKGGYRYAPAPR